MNNNNMDNLLKLLSSRMGVSPDKLQQSAQNNNLADLLKSMDKTQAEKLQQILNDKDKTNKLLNSPQAQALIKKLSGDKP